MEKEKKGKSTEKRKNKYEVFAVDISLGLTHMNVHCIVKLEGGNQTITLCVQEKNKEEEEEEKNTISSHF